MGNPQSRLACTIGLLFAVGWGYNKSEYKHMKELLLWWFSPKQSYSIIKIPIGAATVIIFILSLIWDFADFIAAFRTEPLFTGLFLLFLPLFFFVFFADAIFAGGVFYLPYYIFEEEREGWKSLLKHIGILFGVFVLLRAIRMFVFAGWSPL